MILNGVPRRPNASTSTLAGPRHKFEETFLSLEYRRRARYAAARQHRREDRVAAGFGVGQPFQSDKDCARVCPIEM